jgi:TatD DNase family protein
MNKAKKYPYMVDSHAHLDFSNFDRDREEVLQRAEDQGLKLIVNVGFDLLSSKESVMLAGQHPFVYAAVGIHPHDAAKAPSNYLRELEEIAHYPKVVALGEMGLDFYRDRSPRPVQRDVFRRQLRLAKKVNLPVIIHDRDAHEEVLKILEEEGLPAPGGVMHCFSGELELARKFLKLGLYISIAGPVTYSRNNKLSEVAAAVPLERLLIETDAPFLTPGPLRGKRNEPAYVVFVAEKVAALRGISVESLGRNCLENARRLFSIE